MVVIVTIFSFSLRERGGHWHHITYCTCEKIRKARCFIYIYFCLYDTLTQPLQVHGSRPAIFRSSDNPYYSPRPPPPNQSPVHLTWRRSFSFLFLLVAFLFFFQIFRYFLHVSVKIIYFCMFNHRDPFGRTAVCTGTCVCKCMI